MHGAVAVLGIRGARETRAMCSVPTGFDPGEPMPPHRVLDGTISGDDVPSRERKGTSSPLGAQTGV